MHDYKKKMTLRADKSWKKNTFKYNLTIALLKNLILPSMLFFEKSRAIDH